MAKIDTKIDIDTLEHRQLFGCFGNDGSESKEIDQQRPPDGGSAEMKIALDRVTSESEQHKLLIVDLESEEDVREYLAIKNSPAYIIRKETPFEKVVESTEEGMHVKEVLYKRIVDYVAIDSEMLLKGLIRETKYSKIPHLLGTDAIARYFSGDTSKDLITRYRKATKWVDPEAPALSKKKKTAAKKPIISKDK